MSNNWNVYKVFNNGKRAKAPLHTFQYDVEDADKAEDHFNEAIKKDLVSKYGTKIYKSKFSFIRADLPQDRTVSDNSQQESHSLHMKVFRRHLNSLPDINSNTEGILMFSKDTDWMWSWCVAQAASLKFISAISPGFASYEAAQKWMKEEIEKL